MIFGKSRLFKLVLKPKLTHFQKKEANFLAQIPTALKKKKNYNFFQSIFV